jgi:ribonuclease T1
MTRYSLQELSRLKAALAVSLLLMAATWLALAGCSSRQPATPALPRSPTMQAPHVAPTAQPTKKPTATRTPSRKPTPTVAASGLPTITFDRLPKEARDTIRLIQRGGPFPYRQDGAVFQNREGLLPRKPSGYYHEYTVETPGSADRGARRIIAGEQDELFYTADHYASFKQVVMP